MRVLLIYPSLPDTSCHTHGALRLVGRRSAFAPLGLLTVAAMLPEAWEKCLVDLNVRPLHEQDLAWATCAFVSAMEGQRQSAHEVLGRCRAAGLRTVGGGPLFSRVPESFPEVDHLVLDEAEATLPQFLVDFERGVPRRLYRAAGLLDLRATPVPLWHLAELERYAAVHLEYARGDSCTSAFGSITGLCGNRPRTKSAAQVFAELNGLWDQDWRGRVFLVGAGLQANRGYLTAELLPALVSWQATHPGMPFGAEAAIDVADDEELLRLLRQAGFDTVLVGLDVLGADDGEGAGVGRHRGRNLVADLRRLQRAGLQVEVQGQFGGERPTHRPLGRSSRLVAAVAGAAAARP